MRRSITVCALLTGAWLVGAGVLRPAPATARSLDRIQVNAGDTVIGESLRPGEFDELVMPLPRGSHLSISFGKFGGGSWSPSAAFFTDGYLAFPTVARSVNSIKTARPIERSEPHRLLVAGFNGSVGGFRVRTKVAPGKKFALKGKGTDVDPVFRLPFGCLEGAQISVQIKWKGGAPVQVRHFTGPDGNAIPGGDAPVRKTRSFKQGGFVAEAFGDHLLEVIVPPGTVKWSATVKVKTTRPKGETRDVRGATPPGQDTATLFFPPTRALLQPLVQITGETGGPNAIGLTAIGDLPAAEFSDHRRGVCARTPLEFAEFPTTYELRCTNGFRAFIENLEFDGQGRVTRFDAPSMRSPAGSGSAVLSDFEYDDNLQPIRWTEVRTFAGTGNTHTLRFSDVKRFSGIAGTRLFNNVDAGTGILGDDVAIPVGLVLTDPDADFVAGSVLPGMHLRFISNPLSLNGAGAETTALNTRFLRIVEVTETQLTLSRPMVAESPLPGGHFEYQVAIRGFSLKAYRVEHEGPGGVVRTYDHSPFR